MKNINKERALCNGTRLIMRNIGGLVLELYNPKIKQNVCLLRFDLEADIENAEYSGNVDSFPYIMNLQ